MKATVVFEGQILDENSLLLIRGGLSESGNIDCNSNTADSNSKCTCICKCIC